MRQKDNREKSAKHPSDICGMLSVFEKRFNLPGRKLAKVIGVSQSQYTRYKNGTCTPRPHRMIQILTALSKYMLSRSDNTVWTLDTVIADWNITGKTPSEQLSFLLAVAGGCSGWLEAGLLGFISQPKISAVLTSNPEVILSITCLSGKISIQGKLSLSGRYPVLHLSELRPDAPPVYLESLAVNETALLQFINRIKPKIQGPLPRHRYGIYS